MADTLTNIRIVIGDAWRLDKPLMATVFCLTMVVGLLDGFAMALLFPLVALLGVGDVSSGITKKIADAISATGLNPDFPTVLSIVVGAVVLQNVAMMLQMWTLARLARGFAADLKARIWRAYLDASWSFFRDRKMTDLFNTVGHVEFATNCLIYVIQFVSTLIVTALYLALAVGAAWQVSLMLIFLGASSFMLTRMALAHASRIGEDHIRTSTQLDAVALETTSAIKFIKATAREHVMQARLLRLIADQKRLAVMISVSPAAMRALFEVLAITTVAITLVSATAWSLVEPSALLVIIIIFVRIYPRLTTLQQFLHGLAVHLPIVPDIYATLKAARTNAEPGLSGGSMPVARIGGVPPEIEFRNVTVNHGEFKALDDVSFTILPGSTIAIVGRSGAGKTTLIDAMLGLVAPNAGSILVNGRPLDALGLRHWRNNVAYVGQDTTMFNASIEQNIAWGLDGVGIDEVISAARTANIHDEIMQNPKGYHADAGDLGSRLSGGQRQRIGLARAMIDERPVLLLDEATSALDSLSEAPILSAIRSIKGKRTIVIVAHRLSAVRDADQILVFDRGRVVERGDWGQLARRNGLFAQILNRQLKDGQIALDSKPPEREH